MVKKFLIYKSKKDYLKNSKSPDFIIVPDIKKLKNKRKKSVICVYCENKIQRNYYSKHVHVCKSNPKNQKLKVQRRYLN